MDGQIISKRRVADHGEVFTRKREVDAMLNLVIQETERIESRFLEPACGTGIFLIEVLTRKLGVVELRYKSNQLEYERNAVLSISSIYGIDILRDNVDKCRSHLFRLFDDAYTRLFKAKSKNECRRAVWYILEQNILHGDALELKTVGDDPQPIVFAEWSQVSGSTFKRRDFAFHALLEHQSMRELPLFSDLGDAVFIPEPVKEYPLIHFLRLADVAESEL